jgi:hypothetical protein
MRLDWGRNPKVWNSAIRSRNMNRLRKGGLRIWKLGSDAERISNA